MNENELTELLVQSCESNQSKYVPWWNTDMKHSMYRYHVFSEEEINNITESVNQYSKETLLTLAGNLGFTLFHLLIWHGFYDAVKWALKQGINVNITITDGNGNFQDACTGATPLMLSCYMGNPVMVKLLLENGADTSICDKNGRNAFHYLAKSHIKNLVIPYECRKQSISVREQIAELLFCDINAEDNEKMTPLEYLLYGKDSNYSWALTKVFLEKGADIERMDNNGNSLLITAIKNNHITAALLLMQNKELLNRENNDGKTPLHLAVQQRNTELCIALLDSKAESFSDKNGMFPKDYITDDYDKTLKEFFISGRIEPAVLSRYTSNTFARYSSESRDSISMALWLAKKLIDEIDTEDDDELGAILGILYSGLLEDEKCQLLDLLSTAGIDFVMPIYNGGSITCIRDYCLGGNYGVKVLQKFTNMGIDMNHAVINGRTPANQVASLQKRIMIFGGKDDYFEKAAEFFSAESMMQTDNRGVTAMHEAAKNNHLEMLQVMIKKGADVNITQDEPAGAGDTPLHLACSYGNTEVVRLLIEAGADDAIQNINGETPAHYAVKKRRFREEIKSEKRAEVIEALSFVDIEDNNRNTPLMLLQYLDINTAIQVLPVFLKKEADVNHVNQNGDTALLINTQYQCYKGVIKELVRAGADVNVVNKYGSTPLLEALRYGNQEVARFLIKKGADYNHADNSGITAAQLAAERGYDTVLSLIM
ncbi:ankyrin repeat domain-containing protein [Lachnospiraceae bacterium 48-33]